MSESINHTLEDLADNPAFVIVFYFVILTPLALYVYHDVLDKRWRPVWTLTRYVIIYLALYIVAGIAVIIYIVVQVYAKDYKEVGASSLALIIGTYGAWKLFRLCRILSAHCQLVKVLQQIDSYLARTTGLEPNGLPIHLYRAPRWQRTRTFFHDEKSVEEKEPDWLQEYRHAHISSALFDDDYPGEAAARIRWFTFSGDRIRVVPDDSDECVSRISIWMRLALRQPSSEPWRLLTTSAPLISGILFKGNLGEGIRALVTHGSGLASPPHAHRNSAEVLLNGGSLTTVGIGFFWTACEMGSEEVAQVLAEMPPPWMRGVKQNGKQLMYETAMSLVLCEMPEPGNTGLNWILSLPVLEWRRDITNIHVWETLSVICADAVSATIARSAFLPVPSSPQQVYEIVRSGIFDLKDAESDEFDFQGDTIGLSVLELIRAAYRAGYVAEKLLGKGLKDVLCRHDQLESGLRLYKAEIVIGLFAVLSRLGFDQSDEFHQIANCIKTEWGVKEDVKDVFEALQISVKQDLQNSSPFDTLHHRAAQSRHWFLCNQQGKCADPAQAFFSLATTAEDLAPLVFHMIQEYSSVQPRVKMSKIHGDPERYREQWLKWKQQEAFELRGKFSERPYVELIREDRNGVDIPVKMV